MKNSKGITLIALIITIIVMLILAAVTITIAVNGGLFTQAQKAALETRGAQVEEEVEIWKAGNKSNEYTKGSIKTNKLEKVQELYDRKLLTEEEYTKLQTEDIIYIGSREVNFGEENNTGTILADKVQIGDYVEYTPDTATGGYLISSSHSGSTEGNQTIYADSTLRWRVFDIINGQVRLISDKPTSSEVRLEGYNGYNNGVYILNDMCNKLYKKTGVGTARSLNVDDITRHISGFNDTMIRSWNWSENYGNAYTFTIEKYYPEILKLEEKQSVDGSNGNLKQSEQTSLITTQSTRQQANTRLDITGTVFISPTLSDILPNSHISFFNGSSDEYFLSTRGINCAPDETGVTSYELFLIWDERISCGGISDISGADDPMIFRLRPLVILDVGIEENGKNGLGEWKMKQ